MRTPLLMPFLIVQFAQLPHQGLALLVVQLRRHHLELDDDIAALATGLGDGHALALEAVLGAGLGARRHLDGPFPLGGGHRHLGAQGSLAEADGDRYVEVRTHPGEALVWLHADLEEEVAGTAAAPARLALGRHLQAGTIIHSRRNVDGHRVLAGMATSPLAVGTGRGPGPLAPAVRTDPAKGEEATAAAHPALALATPAGLGPAADLTGAPAGEARLGAVDPQVQPRALEGLTETQAHAVDQVLAALGPVSGGPSANAREQVLKGEVALLGKPRRDLGAGTRWITAGVVVAPLLGIRQHLVGFGQLLELGFSLGIARIQVRVVLAGELAVGLLDVLIRGASRNPQDLVVVRMSHGFSLRH